MVMTSLLERGVHFINRLHDCMQSLKGTTIVPLDVSWRVEHYELYLPRSVRANFIGSPALT